MEYDFRKLETYWQQKWIETNAYAVSNNSTKTKYYVLDMFPYPSGAGLHVGHPLGYIASDIYSRYKRLKGFNVLHPMGYDAFGLPAEQYAVEHGIHPAISTANNINNFRSQLNNIGFCFDWDREVRTCEPNYYKWTQWIFLQLFNSFYNRQQKKAASINSLVAIFEQEGNKHHPIPNSQYSPAAFTANDWKAFNHAKQQDILMQYRLAFCGYGEVNWCEALGTVLANDEVVNGVSERGGHPVVKKKLRQWYLRITEYADRLLEGLEKVEFSEAMKEMQRNWIGKSYGAEMDFAILDSKEVLKVYTTRPDTIFGVDFMVVAPEHEIIEKITTPKHKQEVDDYLTYVKSRSERERIAEKKISGCFTGAYAINPLSLREVPVYISEYVLAGYGTGAIMAVPCGDERDLRFAKHFNIHVTNILGDLFNGEDANATKDAELLNSDFLTGMLMRDASEIVITDLEGWGKGKRKVNYKMRDAAFSRQRYWGEPFPIKWIDGIAYPLDETELPLQLPQVDEYKPGPEGEGPLANIPEWTAQQLETNTMPGFAGSSWYFLRYMDPHNNAAFCDKNVSDYWNQVDIYIGGTEHAVGHLLYSRLWTKVLFDLGFISFEEPFKKLVNQGMIQGSSRFAYRIRGAQQFVSAGVKEQYETDAIHVDVNMVDGFELDTAAFKKWRNGEYANATFILEDGKYICGAEVEKMSKSKFNTVNPDELVQKYGADTFRMYEMFLGPVEQSKPWDTKGIEGVHRFLRKLWRLFFDEVKGKVWNEAPPTDAELKVLHKAIRKIEEDTERFSFNTAVSAFMVCVNELSDLKCNKRAVLEPLLVMLVPYAPHIAEELWSALGNTTLILDASYPVYEAKYTVESAKEYPVSINGKLRTTISIALDATEEEVKTIALNNDTVKKWIENASVKKFIFVKGKMINIVI
jgi:leucyl-tRNA synthetase